MVGLGLGPKDSGFTSSGLGFRVLEFMVFGFRVSGVQAFGFIGGLWGLRL